MATKTAAVQRSLAPVAMRLAGLSALLVALGSLLSSAGTLSAHQAGAIVLGFSAAMIAFHLLTLRTAVAGVTPPESLMAALLGAITLLPGMLLVFWQRPALDATFLLLFGVSNHAASNALAGSAAVALAAYAVGRHPRWLLLAPLALVASVQFRLAAGRSEVSLGGGSWSRFLVFLGAVAVLVAIAWLVRGAVERNLLIAAALLAPFMYQSIPTGDGHAARDLIGAAMLAGLAVAVRGRVTPGTGLGFVVLAAVEVESLRAHGGSKLPAVLFALGGAGLLALSVAAARTPRDDQASA